MALEERLKAKAQASLVKLQGARKPETDDLFKRLAYVFPRDLSVSGYPRETRAAFNPGALLKGRKLLVFPRLVFDYYGYTSSVGLFEVDLEELLSGSLSKPVEARILLWPRELWEFKGCEDARASQLGGRIQLLYTGYGYHQLGEGLELRWVQGFAELDEGLRELRRGFFTVTGGSERFAPKMKDSALLRFSGGRGVLLCRPTLDSLQVCWRAEVDLEKLEIPEESMEPVLVHEEWETHVGWSTNALQLSGSECLVGWHGVLKGDLSYRNGLAVVDGDGRLLALSDYLLAPKGLVEEYGDRPLVVFGCGLARYKEMLLWVGGVSDYAIGFFAAELEKVFEKLRWLSA